MKKHHSPSEFVSKFQAFCNRNALLSTDSLLVAFSGGVDSAVLLSLLQKVCQEQSICLTAFHVNHMIRGEEAERDALFCQEFCKQRNIPFVCESVDVPAIAKIRKAGIEETARNERYRLLTKYAAKEGFSKIATAHNATDNTETVLFHLARGMSTHGAGGIHPMRQNIIRPLLSFTKEEILHFAEEENIPFVTDSTNSDTNYTRNYIRHAVLPNLYKVNPEVDQAVLRFSESARRDDAFLFRLAEAYKNEEDTVTLASLDAAILSRVLLIKTSALANNEISEKHIREIMDKLQTAAQGNFCGSINLPKGLTAFVTRERFLITDTPPEKVPFAERTDKITLTPNRDITFSPHFHVCLRTEASPQSFPNSITVLIAKDSICGTLYLRNREEGDRYVVGGMTRRIKKMLCDAKIPLEKRANLPILCDDVGILYVPYLSVADRVKPQGDAACYQFEITEL